MDLDYLLKLWSAIDGAAKAGKGAFLIYQESSLVIRAIRDYFNNDIGDILIDTDDIYEQAQQFMAHVMPEHANRVKRYRDDAPLFSRFQIEHQIESAYARTVQLPSGGAIVIDHTEALVSVDVNSARAIKGSDIEETATRTNLEAADEVARQMRLRDLGGLIVIDFIDMEESRNRKEVENRLRDALRQDRARVQFGTISKFGLMEMSRQRLKPALSEGAHINCPRCSGSGHIRDTESSALQILRIIQEESMKDNTAAVHCQVPVEVASFLLNEKRAEISKIELKQRVAVLMVPNKGLETPHYRLERLKHDDPRLDSMQSSYQLAEEIADDTTVTRRSQEPTNRQTPVIKGVLPDAPPAPQPAAPARKPAGAGAAAAPASAQPAVQEQGFFSWLKSLFGFGTRPPWWPRHRPPQRPASPKAGATANATPMGANATVNAAMNAVSALSAAANSARTAPNAALNAAPRAAAAAATATAPSAKAVKRARTAKAAKVATPASPAPRSTSSTAATTRPKSRAPQRPRREPRSAEAQAVPAPEASTRLSPTALPADAPMAGVAAETQSAASPATEAPLGRADQHDDGEDSAPRNGRRSRDRYGRDRRGNRTERSPREEQQPDAALQDSTPIEIVLPVAAAHLAPADDNAADDAAPRRRSYFADVRPETGTQRPRPLHLNLRQWRWQRPSPPKPTHRLRKAPPLPLQKLAPLK